MSKPKVVYSISIGGQKIPFMEVKESKDGDEYVIFPLDPNGLHLSAYPTTNPHIKDSMGFQQDLELDLLRKVDWSLEVEKFRQDIEARAYWPSHRADIIAILGPRGMSYFEALRKLGETGDLDLVHYVKVVLGSGIIYKIGPKEREAFFRTKKGKGSFLFDKKEGCFATYAPFIPRRPLLRFGGKFGSIPLHPYLKTWKNAIDTCIHLDWEMMTPKYKVQMEEAFRRIVPHIQAFGKNLKLVRWKPRRWEKSTRQR